MQTKKELRSYILKKRSELTEKEVAQRSKRICSHVKAHSMYRAAQNICLYMPIRNEVDVRYLIEVASADRKQIWLPKVEDDEMNFYLYDENSSFIVGAYNIPEPQSTVKLEPDEHTLIIMPGAVFSKEGDRIGYGGGYYDRYLDRYPICQTAAVCYDFQVVPKLPAEPHDIKPQVLISDYI